MRASMISGLFEDCLQDYCPEVEEERYLHAQLQLSDVFKLKKLAIPNSHCTQITLHSMLFDEWLNSTVHCSTKH